mmetsp:Transcript_82792/g.208452  ORF Transcript_82792/g.208452 Transcript_82792/m.208452 type:complete len:360 (-) Transcript_82792:286-1365(-)
MCIENDVVETFRLRKVPLEVPHLTMIQGHDDLHMLGHSGIANGVVAVLVILPQLLQGNLIRRLVDNRNGSESGDVSVAGCDALQDCYRGNRVPLRRCPTFVATSGGLVVALKTNSAMEAEHHLQTNFSSPFESIVEDVQIRAQERLSWPRAVNKPIAERDAHRIETQSSDLLKVSLGDEIQSVLADNLCSLLITIFLTKPQAQGPLVRWNFITCCCHHWCAVARSSFPQKPTAKIYSAPGVRVVLIHWKGNFGLSTINGELCEQIMEPSLELQIPSNNGAIPSSECSNFAKTLLPSLIPSRVPAQTCDNSSQPWRQTLLVAQSADALLQFGLRPCSAICAKVAATAALLEGALRCDSGR